MNTKNKRNLIASIFLALLGVVGIFALKTGSSEVTMGLGVVVALAILGGIELHGASRRLPTRQPKDSIELYRSVKSEAYRSK